MYAGMEPAVIVAFAVFGLVVGSFLNVVIARLPDPDPDRRKLGGRSRCPSCGHQIAGYDNIPLISYLVLRGRCRSCRTRISPRYPAVELLTALLWAAVAAETDDWWRAVIGVVFMSLLVAITFIDLDHRIIPNVLSLPGTVAGLALGIASDPDRAVELVLSSLLPAVFLIVTILIKPGGMGMGDVKLALMMGAFLGRAVVPAMAVGFLLGAVVGLLLIARKGAQARKMKVPFGPFLAVGSVVAWFWGVPLLHAYLSTLR